MLQAFYAELLAGQPVASALAAGDRAAPELAGSYSAVRLEDMGKRRSSVNQDM